MRSLGNATAAGAGADTGTGAYDAATGAPSGAGVYLLAFLAPDGRGGWQHAPYRHAAHYLGWSTNIRERIGEHVAGCGARLVAVVIAAGYRVQLVRTWPGTRELERALKGRHSGRALCPLCAWNLAGTSGDPSYAARASLWHVAGEAECSASLSSVLVLRPA